MKVLVLFPSGHVAEYAILEQAAHQVVFGRPQVTGGPLPRMSWATGAAMWMVWSRRRAGEGALEGAPSICSA